MTTTVNPPPARPRNKARVLRLAPAIDTPLDANRMDVAVKLRRALRTAQSGATTGALIIELDQKGEWSVERAGELLCDDDTLCLIVCRMFGACLSSL